MSRKKKNTGIIIAIITASSVIVAAIIDVAFRGEQRADAGEHITIPVSGENTASSPTSQDLHVKITTGKGETVSLDSDLVQKWGDKMAMSSGKKTLTRGDVLVLANDFSLTEKTIHNPQLGFKDGDIAFWYEQVKKYGLDEGDLRREFAARRLVLEAADEAGVVIDTQGDLSHFAGEIMAELIRAGKSLKKRDD